MLLVHIYTRHSRTCAHKDDPQYKRCRCVRWVHYSLDGQFFRESTKERSWEQATVYARAVEERGRQLQSPGMKLSLSRLAQLVEILNDYLREFGNDPDRRPRVRTAKLILKQIDRELRHTPKGN
jgi:hypothetical protein